MNLEQLKIISAGAGSGKTYRLTQEMVALLCDGQVRPNGIIATTFTRKAAAELQERVRVQLLSQGLSAQADELANALIGTVHGLGVKLLRRFAFEAGVSPQVDILPDGQQQQMFNQSLAAVLNLELIERMDSLADRLGLGKGTGFYDWRKEVKQIVDVARANDFSLEDMELSQQKSWQSFQQFLPTASTKPLATAYKKLKESIAYTVDVLVNGADQTKVTQSAADKLKGFLKTLELRDFLYWHEWAAISKLKVGAKSRDQVEELQALAAAHDQLADFQNDIKSFIDQLFQTAIAAMKEFDNYKKSRGLIDYTDMEVLVSRLLDHPQVQAVLKDELDLLMVDEFQDTSPIQLEIFIKLSKLTKFAVWVGDPKQSIYGFRGADPRLMQAIIGAAGGVKKENIQINSWRSRQELVELSNAIFCKAFNDLPPEQVALDPIRKMAGSDHYPAEPIEMESAIMHWHFDWDDEQKRAPAQPWMEDAIARSVKELIERKTTIYSKTRKTFVTAKASDVAVLCRSNKRCEAMAEALHRAGLKSAIARTGLLNTAEIRLVLACLKYILQKEDSLSVAEILLLAARKELKEIVSDRFEYVQATAELAHYQREAWAQDNVFIKRLDELRAKLAEMSSAETLDLLLEELDLRRYVVVWGRPEQRLSNIDQLRKYALEYETNCNNMHTAASLGGFLLWLNSLQANGNDYQGAAADEDAVNVLTYHKSKGLEWPISICHDLEQVLRASLWGLSLVAEQEQIDLNNVLKGRWLRYWVNPYGLQEKQTALATKMQESEEQALKKQEALAEEARLMYVGITRARDYIIFPSRHSKTTNWLNRICNEGNDKTPSLDPNTHESPWSWDGRFLDKQTQVFVYPRQFAVAEHSIKDVDFLAPSPVTQQKANFHISAKDYTSQYNITAKAAKKQTYYSFKTTVEKDALLDLAQVQAHFLKAALYVQEADILEELAEQLLERFDLKDDVSVQLLIDQALAWKNYLQQHLPQQKIQQAYPINWHKDGQNLSLNIDLIARNDKEIALVQNLFAHKGKSDKRLLEQSDSLWAASELLQKEFPQHRFSYYVHIIDKGQLVEILFNC